MIAYQWASLGSLGIWNVVMDSFLLCLLLAVYYLVKIFNKRLLELGCDPHSGKKLLPGKDFASDIIECVKFHTELKTYAYIRMAYFEMH